MAKSSKNAIAVVIQGWLKEDSNCWTAIATMFLQRYESGGPGCLDRISGFISGELRVSG
jgi:hypothetical protein